MKLLLDTHVLLWALCGPEKLSARARAAIADSENMVFVSAVSAWEIAIKQATGKLVLQVDLEDAIGELGLLRKDLQFATAAVLRTLPQLHRDPFDRMLIAQSLQEGLPLATDDALIAQYPVQVFW